MLETLQEIFLSFFDVNSVWSIVFRALLWFGVAAVILTTTANAKPERSMKNLKSNLGLFLLFVVLGSGLIYLLFGFTLS